MTQRLSKRSKASHLILDDEVDRSHFNACLKYEAEKMDEDDLFLFKASGLLYGQIARFKRIDSNHIVIIQEHPVRFGSESKVEINRIHEFKPLYISDLWDEILDLISGTGKARHRISNLRVKIGIRP